MDSMKILYDSVKLGEKIGDLRSDKNWSQEELSKKFRECGVKFDKETIAKIENGSYKKEIGIKKLIALSQIFKVSIDDLLDNHIKEKETNKLFIAEQETGLQKDSIDKLKIYQNNAIKTRLLDKKLKLVEDINELDVINYLLSKSDVFSIISNVTQDYIRKNKQLDDKEKIIENNTTFSKESKTIQKTKLEEAKNEIFDDDGKTINNEILKVFRNFIEIQSDEIKKSEEKMLKRNMSKKN